MDTKVELLAPAGDYDAFLAAVENGADAVYLGGKLFNARQFASNFDSEQLKKTLEYAHTRGVKVYLTMNTLMADEELHEAVEFAGEAHSMGIDGIIVQDLGLAGLLRRIYPDMELHASTQMTVYNLEGVRLLEQLGFKRAVLARELSLEEIKYITRNTSLEIEVFVHGALCISYSGQCLMSSMMGGRSGNRGKCAQPCRLKYELVSDNPAHKQADKGYLLSPKDLCSLEAIHKVLDAGVKSLKIEGRMKSPEYVATVVSRYRKYIDGILEQGIENKGFKVDKEDIKDLAQVFNRGGFSKGYLEGKTGKDMMCYEKPKNWGIPLGEVISHDRASKTVKMKLTEELSMGDGVEIWNGEEESPGNIITEIRLDGKNVPLAKAGNVVTIGSLQGRITKGNKVYKTSNKRLNAAARESFTSGKSRRRASIYGEIVIEEDSPIKLYIKDELGNEINVESGFVPEPAENRPLTGDRVREQVCKTGATPFEFSNMRVRLGENLSVPVSELNNLRRRALEELENKRVSLNIRNISEDTGEIKKRLLNFPGNSRKGNEKLQLSMFVYSVKQEIDYLGLDVDRIYLPFSYFLDESRRDRLTGMKDGKSEIFLWLPPITRGNYDRLIKSRLDEIAGCGIIGIMAGNPGSVNYAVKYDGIKAVGDYTLNAFNSFTLEEMQRIGLGGVTLSPELNMSQIEKMRNFPGFTKEAVVYGRIPLMSSEYCPVGSIMGGAGEKSKCEGACSKGEYRLRDRKGMEFPVVCDKIDCRSVILNSNVLFVLDSLDRLKASGVDMVRLNITDEGAGEIARLVKMHREAAVSSAKAVKMHADAIEEIKAKGFTKGHYFRGV